MASRRPKPRTRRMESLRRSTWCVRVRRYPRAPCFAHRCACAQDLYCGVLEEKAEQAESLGGGLKLPSGVEISSGQGSDSDSDEDEEAEGSLSKRRKKALVQELPARSTDAA